jgi:hypothetical protein
MHLRKLGSLLKDFSLVHGVRTVPDHLLHLEIDNKAAQKRFPSRNSMTIWNFRLKFFFPKP